MNIFRSSKPCLWDQLHFRLQKIEIIESLGSWIRENLIKSIHFNGLGLPIELEGVDENKTKECTSNNDNVTSRPMGHPALWATFSTTSNFKHLHHHYELSGA